MTVNKTPLQYASPDVRAKERYLQRLQCQLCDKVIDKDDLYVGLQKIVGEEHIRVSPAYQVAGNYPGKIRCMNCVKWDSKARTFAKIFLATVCNINGHTLDCRNRINLEERYFEFRQLNCPRCFNAANAFLSRTDMNRVTCKFLCELNNIINRINASPCNTNETFQYFSFFQNIRTLRFFEDLYGKVLPICSFELISFEHNKVDSSRIVVHLQKEKEMLILPKQYASKLLLQGKSEYPYLRTTKQKLQAVVNDINRPEQKRTVSCKYTGDSFYSDDRAYTQILVIKYNKNVFNLWYFTPVSSRIQVTS